MKDWKIHVREELLCYTRDMLVAHSSTQVTSWMLAMKCSKGACSAPCTCGAAASPPQHGSGFQRKQGLLVWAFHLALFHCLFPQIFSTRQLISNKFGRGKYEARADFGTIRVTVRSPQGESGAVINPEGCLLCRWGQAAQTHTAHPCGGWHLPKTHRDILPGREWDIHSQGGASSFARREKAFQAQRQLQHWREGRERESLAHAATCYFNMTKQPKLVNASPAPARNPIGNPWNPTGTTPPPCSQHGGTGARAPSRFPR